MNKQTAIKLFETTKIRTAWNENEEEWYFSVIDVVEVLTESPDPKRYWSVLKTRLKQEGIEGTTICSTLKLLAQDGKMRLTDVASTEQIFRIIQSIPSPKAEPFKQWLAQVAKERIDQLQDPELSIEQAMTDYRRLGYSESWINQRLKSIEIRKELTDEWKQHGLQEGVQFASLTDIIYKTWGRKNGKRIQTVQRVEKRKSTRQYD
jgi:prophage antirepressor-like protein